PGNNKNPAKAKHLRSFPLPQRFVHPGARRMFVRKINILGAIVMDQDVIILTDFSRMSQVHIVSSSQILQLPDIQSGSLVYPISFPRFRGDPDWIFETDAALAGLDSWPGVGQHLANDLLFGLALHPETPNLTICSSDELYQELRAYLPVFMGTWASSKYLTRCASRPNSTNPFVFHDVSDINFMQSYVLMYRRCQVRMAAKDYNNYGSKGLFDPNHIIGTPYHGEWTMYTGKWKDVPVCMFKGTQSNMYYVICATPPADWNTSTEVFDFKDVTNAGFATTVGPASFFEPMQNKLDLNQLHSMVHAGQPRKV
ncbi:hypothetical protein C8J57DRAFT_962824, partial [Mycena rebaudengoi]